MPDLIQAFRATLRGLVQPGDAVLVAVSGGADSMALLDLVARVGKRWALRPTVVHLDHGWRAESADDARFVAEEAERRGLPSIVGRATDLAPTEASGRQARWEMFAASARRADARAVLLGHTADDQAETVLLHLIRGSGLAGLAGMRPSTEITVGGIALRLIRPLLDVSRAQLRAYCRGRGIAVREDASNLDVRYARNRLRALLPSLEDIHPGAVASIARLARTVADDADFIAGRTLDAWSRVAAEGDRAVSIDRSGFRIQEPTIQRALLRRVAERLIGPAPDLPLERVEAARQILLGGPGGAVVQWPGGVRLVVAGRSGIFALELHA